MCLVSSVEAERRIESSSGPSRGPISQFQCDLREEAVCGPSLVVQCSRTKIAQTLIEHAFRAGGDDVVLV